MLPVSLILNCVVVVSSGTTPLQEGVAPLPNVEQCMHALEDSDTRIRQQGIKDLARLDVVNTETIIQIVEIYKSHHNEELMERDVLMALESLGVKAAPAVPFLTDVLLDGKDPANYLAGRALAAMGPAAAPAIPSLMKALRSARPVTRAMAAEVLGSIGSDAGEAVPILFDMALHDKEGGFVWSVEAKALHALAKIGAPALPLLLESLTSEGDRRREIAAYVLHTMTLESRDSALPARSSLRNAMQDANAHVRVDAALAYWNLSKEPDAVLPVLLSVIRNYVQDRDRSKTAGRRIGMPPSEVEGAVIGLRELGADAAPAVGLLIDILGDTTGGLLDFCTVETLGALGYVAKPAIPRLRQMSTSPGRRMRQAVKDALDNITSSTKNAAQGSQSKSENPGSKD